MELLTKIGAALKAKPDLATDIETLIKARPARGGNGVSDTTVTLQR